MTKKFVHLFGILAAAPYHWSLGQQIGLDNVLEKRRKVDFVIHCVLGFLIASGLIGKTLKYVFIDDLVIVTELLDLIMS